jgi:hypothetical protein
MACPNCGAEFNDNRRFCGKCGSEMNAPAAAPESAPPPATPPSTWGAPGTWGAPTSSSPSPPPPPPAPPPPPTSESDPFAPPNLYAPPPGVAGPPPGYPPPGYPPPGYPPPGYPPPAGYSPGAWPGAGYAQRTNTFAIISLVLGLVGWLACGLGSVAAIVFGFIARDQIKRSQGRERGTGMATAGIVLGFVAVALLLLVFVVSLASSGSNA